jgi:type IV fimbrial biogenesis protein FimT
MGDAMDCNDSKGFTLVELACVVGISGILLMLAIPSFIDLIRASQLTAQSNHFIAAVNFARSEAIKRNDRVFICVRSGTRCDVTSEWEKGWLVFVDRNGNRLADVGETIGVFDALASGYVLRSNASVRSLAFYENGSVRRGSGALPMMSFRLCAPDAVMGEIKERSREVVINQLGRMRYQFGREGRTRCT